MIKAWSNDQTIFPNFVGFLFVGKFWTQTSFSLLLPTLRTIFVFDVGWQEPVLQVFDASGSADGEKVCRYRIFKYCEDRDLAINYINCILLPLEAQGLRFRLFSQIFHHLHVLVGISLRFAVDLEQKGSGVDHETLYDKDTFGWTTTIKNNWLWHSDALAQAVTSKFSSYWPGAWKTKGFNDTVDIHTKEMCLW